MRRSALTGLTGYLDSGNINVQGEEQKKLDVITNDVLKNALRYTGRMGVIASEEEDAPVEVEDDTASRYNKDVLLEETGKYVCVFDPLDGSSNVDANIPTGTIFGIYEEPEGCSLDFQDDGTVCQTLRSLRAHGWTREFSPARKAATEAAHVDVDPRFLFVHWGYNVRPMETQAAMASVQLKRLESLNKNRRANFYTMKKLLGEASDTHVLSLPVAAHGVVRPTARTERRTCSCRVLSPSL